MADRVIEELDEAESLRLIAPGGIGRIAYASRFGPAVLPVNYKWHDGAIVFRTTRHSALDEDLQTGIAGGDYTVAFEIDEIDVPGRQGWSVLIQGPAHHVEAESERRAAEQAELSRGPPGSGNCSCGSSRTASPAAASIPPSGHVAGAPGPATPGSRKNGPTTSPWGRTSRPRGTSGRSARWRARGRLGERYRRRWRR